MSKKNRSSNNIPGAAKSTPQHAPVMAKNDTAVPGNSFTDKLAGKELYILLAAMIVACGIIFWDFISLEKVYLYKDIGSDSINIYFPWLAHLSDYVRSTSMIPTWTFSQGMGQNLFPLWLGDFFSDIILLLFDKDRLPYVLAFVEVIKIILSGFVFYKFLSELKLRPFVACLGGFLFAFSGYIILGSCWTIFSVEALYAAIILYGFERWLNRGKWLWFVVGIACMSFLQPFFLFAYTIFLAVYAPVRYNDLRSDKWNKFPLFVITTAGLAALGVAISAYQLFPDLLQYIESPRVGGEAQLITKLKAQPIFGVADEYLRFTTTFRSFGADMLGTGKEFKGWQNYLEAPLFYCGLFCLVVFPQVFSGLNKKQKIAYGTLAGLFTLPLFFPFFRYTFWAYTGDYFRTFSLVITLLLIIFSARALDHIITTRKVNLIVLGVTVAFLLFLLYTPSPQFSESINQGMRSVATLLIFIYAGLLFLFTRPGNAATNAGIALAVLCFLEVTYFSNTTVNDRDIMTSTEVKDRVGYNDYTIDAVKYIKARDKSFYRVNKDYFSGLAMHGSINDAKVQGYYGTPSYFSFNQKNYIKFLADVNVLDPKDENATRWAMGLMNRPLLFSMAGGKYALSKRPDNNFKNFGYDSLAKFGDVTLYQNKFNLPLGFTYDQVLDAATFKTLSPFQKDVYLLRGCVVAPEDNDLMAMGKKFSIADTSAPFAAEAYGQYVAALRKDTLSITHFKESDIVGEITLATPKILFYSIPFDEGWKATVNGADTKLYRLNCGLTGLKLPAGKSVVDLKFEPRLMMKGAMVSLLAILVFIGLILMDVMKGRKQAAQV